ncbi:MAG: NAAT family transporter [Alphaproteobacteria bacterium]|nr:NAAT family transporter [Alphaproteobacteria bacterium]
METAYFLKVFAALFAIMSPIANLPVFLSLTADRTPGEARKVAVTVIAGLVVGAALILLTGDRLLGVFGIGLNDFRLAGGLLILLIALSMLHGGESTAHAGTAREKDHHKAVENPGIYPLTVPILLGPGTISTIIVFKQQANGAAEQMAVVAAIAASVTLIGATFLAGPALGRLLGQTAISIMSRIMGMILAAIAMEMMVSSLRALWPGLAG